MSYGVFYSHSEYSLFRIHITKNKNSELFILLSYSDVNSKAPHTVTVFNYCTSFLL